MLALFWKTIRLETRKLTIYSTLAVAFMWMYVAIFPSFKDSGEEFVKLVENYPQGFLELFGVGSIETFTTIEGFLGVEHYSLLWPLLGLALIITVASAMFASEIENGTIEVLLSQPISRFQVFLAKYFSGVVVLSIFTIFSVFSVIPFAEIYDVSYSLQNHVTIATLSFLLGMSVYAITIMLSSLMSSRGRVASTVTGVLLVMYAIDIFASLKESLSDLRYFSLFHYYDFRAAILDNIIDEQTWIVLGGVTILCSMIALVIFLERDVAT